MQGESHRGDNELTRTANDAWFKKNRRYPYKLSLLVWNHGGGGVSLVVLFGFSATQNQITFLIEEYS